MDLGREVIASLRDCLGVDAAGSPVLPHRFSWSPSGREQSAWVSPALEHDDDAGFRVDVRTDLALRLDGRPEAVEALPSRLALATLCGVVRHSDDPGRILLASSLRVHAGNRGRAVRLLSAAARLQLHEAFVLDRLGATPPREGRPEPGLGHGEPKVPLPAATWSDVDDCAAALRDIPGVRAVRMPGGVTASLPFGEGVGKCLLELLAVAERPAVGQGIEVVLTLPGGEGGLACALELNEREIATRSDTDLLGSWSTRPGARAFTTFLPVAAWSRGLVLETVVGFLRRIRGVASLPTSSRS